MQHLRKCWEKTAVSWLKPPVKHSHRENSDSKEEDEPKEVDEDVHTSDVTRFDE